MPINTLGRLTDPEQFGDIIVKVCQVQANPPPTTILAPPPAEFGLPNPTSSSPSPGTSPLGPLTSSGTSGNLTSNGTSSSLNSSGVPGRNAALLSTLRPATTPGTPLSGVSSSGGGSTGGGGTTPGGGTTTGGAMGGATGSATSGSLPGLSINSTTTAESNGAISATTMGRGPGPPAAAIVRLRDVARVELGAQQYTQACTFDGLPSVGLAVFQLPGTNALDVSDRVKAKMRELSRRFPADVDYRIGYDITPFIRESVDDVVHTLFEAVVLVGLVVLLFLQSWRAVIIPMVAVPVAIIGTFAVSGRGRLQPEQHLALWPGAGHRHRGGRRHCRRRERGALAGPRPV